MASNMCGDDNDFHPPRSVMWIAKESGRRRQKVVWIKINEVITIDLKII